MTEFPGTTLRERTFSRLNKSIIGDATDGHAVFNYYTFPFYHHITGVPLDRYFHDPKVMFETQFQVLEQLEKCGSFQPDPGPVAECSSLGGIVQFDAEGFISVRKSGISTLDEVMRLQPGDPYGDNYMRIALETLSYMLQHAPADIKVNPPICMAPFSVCAQLVGISEFCIDIIEEPEIVEALLNVATETCIRYMKECEKLFGGPLHHLLLSDDLSSFLSPGQFDQWVVPTYKKIFQSFPDSQHWLHNDAQAGHLIRSIADAGFVAWQYAPSIPSEQAMEKSGGRVALLGGLNPLEVQHMSAQQTYDRCIEKLVSFNGNNKYVLGVGGSVNQIPVDNVLAILHAADDYKIV
jgi:uroporphyrinogen-III decarboxylase